MNSKPIFLAFILLFLACGPKGQKKNAGIVSDTAPDTATVVVKNVVTDELSGGAYRKRADGYRVAAGKDTSDFVCIFTESNENGRVGLDFYFTGGRCTRTFSQRIHELGIILPVAADDYDFTQFSLISMGRLIESGDLAAGISVQYNEKWGESDNLKDYRQIAAFLKESRLGTCLDSLLQPFSLKVESVVVEKVIFTTRKDLFMACVLEQDTSYLPPRILDCITWVNLGVGNP